MMMGAEMGGKITSIELVDLTADDRKRSRSRCSRPTASRRSSCCRRTKKLVIKSETKDKSGSRRRRSEVFVGEADGKLCILVPAASR